MADQKTWGMYIGGEWVKSGRGEESGLHGFAVEISAVAVIA